MKSKTRIGVIGCTKSTENLISSLIENIEIDLVGLITLDSSVSKQKARFVEIDPKNFDKKFFVVPVLNLHDIALEEKLNSWDLDILIEIGWSHKIPKSILTAPKFGTVGIHNSLLPAYQGGASLNWALIKDFSSWGCTLFHLEEDIDAGEIIFQESFEITDDDDINSLFEKSDHLSTEMILRFIPLACDDLAPRIKQNPQQISKTLKRKPEDSIIKWSSDNRSIFNLIRALKKPYPNAFTFFNKEKILINGAKIVPGKKANAGTVTDIQSSGFVVATGSGSLLITDFSYIDGSMVKMHIGDIFDD